MCDMEGDEIASSGTQTDDGEVHVRASSRERNATAKFQEWESQQCEKNFRMAISTWRRNANKLETLMSDSEDIAQIQQARDALQDDMQGVSDAYERVCNSSLGEPERDTHDKYDSVEWDDRKLSRMVADYIIDRKSETTSRASFRSLGSRKSVKSNASGNLQKTDAAVEAAELKAQLKHIESETAKRIALEQQKAELLRAETMKKLDMAEAKLRAIEQTEPVEFADQEIVDRDVLVADFVLQNPPLPQQGMNVSAEEFVQQNTQAGVSVPITSAPIQNTIGQNRSSVTPHIDDSSTNFQLQDVAKSFAQHITLSRLPPPEPTIFCGDPLTYPSWKSGFQALIETKGIPPMERIHYLQRYLGGDAKAAVEGYFLIPTENAFEEAKQLLEQRYGDSFVVANAFRHKLDNWPKIASRDGLALRKFADFLRQCNTAQGTIPSLSILNDDHENKKLLSKIPEWLITRWGRIVAYWKTNQRKFPPFSEFVSFLVKESDIACDPITSLQSFKNVKQPDSERFSKPFRQRPKRNSGSSSFSTATNETSCKDADQSCMLCQGKHHVDNCKTFLAKPLTERKDFAKSKGLCFACLDQGHRSRGCKKRLTCKICSKKHPTSLHGDYRDRNNINHNKHAERTSVSHLSNANHGNKCSMIVPVWMSHSDQPDSEKLVYALLDTQSDTTFVLDESLRELGVTGPKVKLLLSTMYASDQMVVSRKISGLTVRGYNTSLKITLPATYTRDIMPANRGHIPTPEMAKLWPHLEKISDKIMPLDDSTEIGLLIGYNCSRALAPREVIPPTNDEPYAQRTDLLLGHSWNSRAYWRRNRHRPDWM